MQRSILSIAALLMVAGVSNVAQAQGQSVRLLPPSGGGSFFDPTLGIRGQVLPTGGLHVVGIRPGGVASLNGVEHGDVIIKVNFRKVYSQADLNQAIWAGQGRADMVIRDVRTGRLVRRVMFLNAPSPNPWPGPNPNPFPVPGPTPIPQPQPNWLSGTWTSSLGTLVLQQNGNQIQGTMYRSIGGPISLTGHKSGGQITLRWNKSPLQRGKATLQVAGPGILKGTYRNFALNASGNIVLTRR